MTISLLKLAALQLAFIAIPAVPQTLAIKFAPSMKRPGPSMLHRIPYPGPRRPSRALRVEFTSA